MIISKFKKPNLLNQFLLIGLLVPLSMDSKYFSFGQGDLFKIILIGISISCAFFYLLLEFLSARPFSGYSWLQVVLIVWWGYLLFSPIPVFFWKGNLIHYLKIILPFFLYGIGLMVVVATEKRRIDPAILIDILLWGALLSVLWKVPLLLTSEVSFKMVRLKILGPGVPLLLGYGIAGLYLWRRPKLSGIAFSMAFTCVLLSFTRSYIICAFFVISGLIIADVRRRSVFQTARSGTKLIFLLTFFVILAGVLSFFLCPDLVVIWFDRLFHHHTSAGMDITLLIRFAEYTGQLDALTKNALTFLIGNGIGANYTWDTEILRTLPFIVQNQTFWHAGHSTWVYPFFASGIFFGMFLPLIFLWVLAAGFSAASVGEARGGAREAVLAFAIYLSYLGLSFTANVFNEHWTGLILGIVSGVLMVYSGKVGVKSSFGLGSLKSIGVGS